MKSGYKASLKLATALKTKIKTKKFDVVLCPDFSSLSEVGKIIKDSTLKLGAQNVARENIAALTGEVSPLNLKEIGVSYVLVGHSERRQFFGENDSVVNVKLKNLLSLKKIIPVLCIGENAGDDYRIILKQQLLTAFKGIKIEKTQNIVVAYEPVWAIGTGDVCPPNHAENVHRVIRDFLEEIFSPAIFKNNFRLVYGGSVDAKNAPQFAALANVDGLLVGGASLEAKSFAAICFGFAS